MGEAQGMFLDPKHWSTNSHPQAGDRPQELLNEQFIRDCDAVIAVLGTRFGTPTGKYDSGTEEEIEEMLKAGKPVFLYFSEVSKDPSAIDVAQFDKVKAFKEKYRTHGLYGVFKALESIERQVHSDLSLYFLKQPQAGHTAPAQAQESTFEISCDPINPDSPDCLALVKFERERFQTIIQKMVEPIEKKIKEVIKLSPPPKAVAKNFDIPLAMLAQNNQVTDIIKMFNEKNSVLGGPVEVEEPVQVLISNFVQNRFGTKLDEGFFHLEDLRENRMMRAITPFPSGPHYSGSEQSQKKFSLICDIEREIERVVGLEDWLKQMDDVAMLTPVLKNTGGHFDEDITVDLFFPPNSLWPMTALKVPEFECSEFVTEQLLPYLFEPRKKYDIEIYADFPEQAISRFVPSPYPKTRDEVAKDRARSYSRWLKDHFQYEIHEADGSQVVSCRFSYLRQHTATYFPAPLLLKKTETEIKYRIRSKHSSKVSSGTLKVN